MSCITSVDGIILWLLIIIIVIGFNNQSIIPSTDVIQLTLTLKMTTAQVVETSVTVNNNSPIQDYVHPDDQTQPTFDNIDRCIRMPRTLGIIPIFGQGQTAQG